MKISKQHIKMILIRFEYMVMGSCPKCDAIKTFSLQSRQNTEE